MAPIVPDYIHGNFRSLVGSVFSRFCPHSQRVAQDLPSASAGGRASAVFDLIGERGIPTKDRGLLRLTRVDETLARWSICDQAALSERRQALSGQVARATPRRDQEPPRRM